jgi:hypothetical protein
MSLVDDLSKHHVAQAAAAVRRGGDLAGTCCEGHRLQYLVQVGISLIATIADDIGEIVGDLDEMQAYQEATPFERSHGILALLVDGALHLAHNDSPRPVSKAQLMAAAMIGRDLKLVLQETLEIDDAEAVR